MNHSLLKWTLVRLFFSPAMVAQQLGSGRTMPSVSDDNIPNNKSDHSHQMSTKDVAERLQKDLDNKNAAHASSKIQAAVYDQSITLSGAVTSHSQHEMGSLSGLLHGTTRKRDATADDNSFRYHRACSVDSAICEIGRLAKTANLSYTFLTL